MQRYRYALFTRIVPVDQGHRALGPEDPEAYGEMGILGFAETDVQTLSDRDEAVAAPSSIGRARRSSA
jgi:hypothetical protein